MNDYKVFTDGAFSSSRQQGGSAFVILKDDVKVMEDSRTWKHGSNNTAEILAVLTALSTFKNSVNSITIYSDSQYVLGCLFLGWKRRKNTKLWEIFDKVMEKVNVLCPDIKGIHIDGHQKDDTFTTKWNNYCDRLAVEASHEII